MKKYIVVLFLFITTPHYPSIACDCVTPTFREAFSKYNDVIFVGILQAKVDSTNLYTTSPFGPTKYYNFTILKYYKGIGKVNQLVSILQEGSNCDFPFESMHIGDTLLIYGNTIRFGFGHFVETNGCSRTKFTSDIKDREEEKFYLADSMWKYPVKPDKAPIEQGLDLQEKNNQIKFSLINISLVISLIINLLCIIIIFRTTKPY